MVQVFGKILVNQNGILYFQAFQIKEVVDKYQIWHHQLRVSLLKLTNYGHQHEKPIRIVSELDITPLSTLLFVKTINYNMGTYKERFESKLLVMLQELRKKKIDYNNLTQFEAFLSSNVNSQTDKENRNTYIPKITLDKRIISHHKNSDPKQNKYNEKTQNIIDEKTYCKQEIVKALREQDDPIEMNMMINQIKDKTLIKVKTEDIR